MILQNPFRGWQYGVAGVFTGIGAERNESLQTPPPAIFTKIGLVVTGSVVFIVISINLTLFARYSIKYWVPFYFKNKIKKILRKTPVLKKYDDEFTIDHLTKIFAEDFINDIEERSVNERDPNFRDEYLFYKYYYKVSKFIVEREELTELPPGLEEKYEEAHKNYLIMSISGVQND